MSTRPSTGTTDSPERVQEPADSRDEPTLTVSQPEAIVQQGRSRTTDLPDGDSVTLRLARCLGLR